MEGLLKDCTKTKELDAGQMANWPIVGRDNVVKFYGELLDAVVTGAVMQLEADETR